MRDLTGPYWACTAAAAATASWPALPDTMAVALGMEGVVVRGIEPVRRQEQEVEEHRPAAGQRGEEEKQAAWHAVVAGVAPVVGSLAACNIVGADSPGIAAGSRGM